MSEFNLIYLYFYDITWLRCKFQLLVFEICHFNGEIKKNNNLVSFLVKLAEEKAKIFGPYLFIDICHFRHIIFINGDYWKYIQVNLYKITTCMKDHFQYLKKKIIAEWSNVLTTRVPLRQTYKTDRISWNIIAEYITLLILEENQQTRWISCFQKLLHCTKFTKHVVCAVTLSSLRIATEYLRGL